MPKQKDMKQKQKTKEKKHIHPGDIKGKIEVHDTRARKDGPGGN